MCVCVCVFMCVRVCVYVFVCVRVCECIYIYIYIYMYINPNWWISSTETAIEKWINFISFYVYLALLEGTEHILFKKKDFWND